MALIASDNRWIIITLKICQLLFFMLIALKYLNSYKKIKNFLPDPVLEYKQQR